MTTTADKMVEHILIASTDMALRDALSAVLLENYRVQYINSANSVRDTVMRESPALILIDPVLLQDSLTECVTDLTNTNRSIKIIIIENQTNRQINQYALFKAGAHGFCKENISTPLLNRAVQMVLEGEYWIQRKLIAKMITDLANETSSSHHPHTGADNSNLEMLTPRELEVAKMVRMGENNKMIARELDISERTVKAHLSAIFRKLDIQNRLHLALYFNETI